jgi:hypothetical protein
MKPRVITRCPASYYSGPNCRIIEFAGEALGGLIAFTETDGKLYVDVYRCDPGVIVRPSGQAIPAEYPTPQATAVAKADQAGGGCEHCPGQGGGCIVCRDWPAPTEGK